MIWRSIISTNYEGRDESRGLLFASADILKCHSIDSFLLHHRYACSLLQFRKVYELLRPLRVHLSSSTCNTSTFFTDLLHNWCFLNSVFIRRNSRLRFCVNREFLCSWAIINGFWECACNLFCCEPTTRTFYRIEYELKVLQQFLSSNADIIWKCRNSIHRDGVHKEPLKMLQTYAQH